MLLLFFVVVVVVAVAVVVVVVNRRFLLNYVAPRNLWYVKFKNVLVVPIKTNHLIILPTLLFWHINQV